MKVYFKTVGCRVNQVETESLREKFSALGHTSAASPEQADLIVVNTCSVTARADRDCLAFLRKAAAANPGAGIAVTGCLATLEPEKVLAAAPGARVFDNKRKDELPFLLCGASPASDFSKVTGFHGRARAFIKVQDGCDLRCAYCLVNKARSELSSKPLAGAVAEVAALAASGFREVVLCGTRLGIYRCPATGANLAGLMRELFKLSGEFRLRFSSIEPGELSPDLLAALQKGGARFCDYFHVPLQAGSDKVLREMGRSYDTKAYRQKVRELRQAFPRAGIYADIIAGYPTESDGDFQAGLAFVESLALSGLHVFGFSARPGTRAAGLKPLSPATVTARSARLRALDASLRASSAAGLVGAQTQALVLRNKDGRAEGLASNFMTLHFPGPLKPGSLLQARITGARGGACGAEVSAP